MSRTKSSLEIQRPKLSRKIWNYRIFYLMMAVGVLYFVVFKYATLYGLLIAFKKYSFKNGIWGSKWVGLANFEKVFRGSELSSVFRNTLIISMGKLILGFPAPIILALLLNEVRHTGFKRAVQSVLYMPRFLSWIIMAGICSNLFSSTNGVLPLLVKKMGGTMPSLITDPRYFRGFLYATDIWKGMGWGTIIYLAAITGIDPQLYEAATIDGCNRFQNVIYITLPCISTTVVTLLVLNVGGIMNAGFDQIFALYSDKTRPVADIIDTYVYRLGLQTGKYEYATVIGMAKSVINCILLFSANWVAGKISGDSPL